MSKKLVELTDDQRNFMKVWKLKFGVTEQEFISKAIDTYKEIQIKLQERYPELLEELQDEQIDKLIKKQKPCF